MTGVDQETTNIPGGAGGLLRFTQERLIAVRHPQFGIPFDAGPMGLDLEWVSMPGRLEESKIGQKIVEPLPGAGLG